MGSGIGDDIEDEENITEEEDREHTSGARRTIQDAVCLKQ